jgi:hypothetical protein
LEKPITFFAVNLRNQGIRYLRNLQVAEVANSSIIKIIYFTHRKLKVTVKGAGSHSRQSLRAMLEVRKHKVRYHMLRLISSVM